MADPAQVWSADYLANARRWTAWHPQYGHLGILCDSAGAARKLVEALNATERGPDNPGPVGGEGAAQEA